MWWVEKSDDEVKIFMTRKVTKSNFSLSGGGDNEIEIAIFLRKSYSSNCVALILVIPIIIKNRFWNVENLNFDLNLGNFCFQIFYGKRTSFSDNRGSDLRFRPSEIFSHFEKPLFSNKMWGQACWNCYKRNMISFLLIFGFNIRVRNKSRVRNISYELKI